jgi:hypothetical protein
MKKSKSDIGFSLFPDIYAGGKRAKVDSMALRQL